MRLTRRLASSIADCYGALRAAGFDQAAAARIIVEESEYQINLILEARRHERGERDDSDPFGATGPASDQPQGVG